MNANAGQGHTGALGHGLSVGVGLALAGRLSGRYKDTLFPVPYALYSFQARSETRYDLLSAAMIISLFPLAIV